MFRCDSLAARKQMRITGSKRTTSLEKWFKYNVEVLLSWRSKASCRFCSCRFFSSDRKTQNVGTVRTFLSMYVLYALCSPLTRHDRGYGRPRPYRCVPCTCTYTVLYSGCTYVYHTTYVLYRAWGACSLQCMDVRTYVRS